MDEFDLRTSPWIGVTFRDPPSDVRPIGLRELFLRSTDIIDVNAPLPPAMAGLMRVLSVLTAQITGLDKAGSASQWHRLRAELLEDRERGFDEDEINRVLSDDSHFRLFDVDRPFLQDPRLSTECPGSTGVNKLQWTRIAGNNQVFLSHDTDVVQRPLTAAESVWHLLAWLYYGPSGTCTPRTVQGTRAGNTGSGPLRRTLSVHPMGDNLYETLLLNQAYVPPGDGVAMAPWEDQLNDPLSEPPMPSGFAGILSRRFRHAVLLVPNEAGDAVVDAYITWAWRYPHGEVDDPFVPYQENKKGDRFPRYARADRAIWRDLDSLILESTVESRDDRPQVLVELSELSIDLLERLRIRAIGYDQDGQTRDKAYFQETTPPILGVLKNHDLDDRVRRVHDAASGCGESLRRALRLAWQELRHDPKAEEPAAAMADYWSRAGRRFWGLVESREPLPIMPNEFIRIALSVWDTVTGAYETGPDAIKTLETHRTRLLRGWRKDAMYGDGNGSVEQSQYRDQAGNERLAADDDW
ncbi:CRISPR-associated Cse1 family protein [Stackebrandtia endophytica]|uniref:CRISPR-associated Cse1 family protein n=1 Tax=Stackebrandtia endophytica TaxID=1496996 RepID=A0A543AS43_9ACTN|nr:type I-E CRISPR-associated protein Cse1/CasA [Stackebrandtia endophytica]TQL75394.1 CRISPR-associated Cse1 family protein [Stackebrandtia endophytica]